MVITITLKDFPILSFENITTNDELNGNVYFIGTLNEWGKNITDQKARNKEILTRLTLEFDIKGNIVNDKGGPITEDKVNPLDVLSGLLFQFLARSILTDLRVTTEYINDALNFDSLTILEYINIDINAEDNLIIITPADTFNTTLTKCFNRMFQSHVEPWKQALRDYLGISSFKEIQKDGGKKRYRSSRKSPSSRRRRSTKRRTTSRKQQKRRRGSRRAH